MENEAVPIKLDRAPTAIAEISPHDELANAKYLQKQVNQFKAEINGKVAELEQEQNKEKKE